MTANDSSLSGKETNWDSSLSGKETNWDTALSDRIGRMAYNTFEQERMYNNARFPASGFEHFGNGRTYGGHSFAINEGLWG